ncbi:polyprenyl synthetase family protein [Streptomyces sp. NPDC088789]|uniref:polyprenyl synthetase family protein n=1 Tax=Streptomyces sp. NPDC088789 TaxID=3365899 RepID=UPI00382EB1DB
MTAGTTAPTEPLSFDRDQVRAEIDGTLDSFLTLKARTAAGQRMPAEVTRVLRDFLTSGGKRIRPLLCLTGWHTAGGQGHHPRPLVQAAASLEMFHAFCLVHDDVIDQSHTRRGRPTVHRALAAHHHGRALSAADRLGTSAAILVGDLALAWSDELLHTAGLTDRQLTDVLPLFDAMRTEVMYGQYLDVIATVTATTPATTSSTLNGGDSAQSDPVGRALAICRYKTAKYTVERPLHIGAALAGAGPSTLTALTAYALPLGEAFQLRDDLLGVYGDPARTGKPALDDLREGKATVLVALALRHASPPQAEQLHTLLGRRDLTEEQADTARGIITATGAVQRVEAMITERYEQALRHLGAAPLEPASAHLLREFADSAVHRSA